MAGRLSALFATLIAFLAFGTCRAAPASSPGGDAARPPVKPNNDRSPIGTNLAEIRDWSAEWPFADAFKTSRVWISGSDKTWDDGRQVDLDQRGWVRSIQPGQIARTLLFAGKDARVPGGDYTVLHEGGGEITYRGNAKVISRSAGRDIVRVQENGGQIQIDLQDNLRNIRVIMPGASEKDLFHPAFLEKLGSFSVLRFMDWIDANHAWIERWEDRPRPEDARWTNKGIPVEVMVALANAAKADPWFTIPHTASDAYVEAFAAAVKTQLDPGRRVYVEHSNEIWNGVFPQAAFCKKRGAELGLSKDPYEAQLLYHARRSLEIFAIFESVLGKDRVITVMASHAENPWVSETLLGYAGAKGQTDALAIAPYFGGHLGMNDARERIAKMSPDAFIEALRAAAVDMAAQRMKKQAAVAKKHGVALVAYEGGQHLVGVGPVKEDAAINRLFDAANRDRRMGEIYAAYLDQWRKAGGQLFVHFTSGYRPSKHGRWGAWEWTTQPREDAPKLDALLDFVERNPRWW